IYNQRNHNSTTPHHPPNTRLLCECELYAPVNYDNDLEMKEVMENFNKQTQQRFHEYDERMKTTRQKCNDKCDKEIQKIILKDKLEKELAEKFVTLQTDIHSDAIPTCICETSLADKVEKGCLRCGSVFGGGVAPGVGLLGGIGQVALNAWKDAAIISATKEAVTEATALATQAGVKAVISKINELIATYKGGSVVDLPRIVTSSNYKCGLALVERAKDLFGEACTVPDTGGKTSFCYTTVYSKKGEYYLGDIAKVGANTYEKTLTTETPAFTEAKVGAVEATYASYQTIIIASIVAILIIVLIMKKKKNEEKTPIHKTIRRIDM
ncbi:hypothetical protein PFAG_06068, partial [Plasmodium falciparum Santa Lucia]